MKKKYYWIVGFIVVLIFIIIYFWSGGCCGNITRVVSGPSEVIEAPGCNVQSGVPGGCFGTHAIANLSIEPEVSCLKIMPNNCNDGILEIINDCAEPLIIGGLKIEKEPPLNSIDAIRLPNNEIIVNYSNGNFANYKPSFDDFITINGVIGNTIIKISYIKTKSLC